MNVLESLVGQVAFQDASLDGLLVALEKEILPDLVMKNLDNHYSFPTYLLEDTLKSKQCVMTI